MAIEYCDIGKDLTDAYSDIHTYNKRRDLTGDWELHSGAVWKLQGAGYIEQVFEDGEKLADNGAIPDGAGEFFYDEAADTLYVRLSDDTHPDQHMVQGGVDWKTFLTRCRNDAQEIAEGYLRNHYFTPFSKIIKTGTSYNERAYDFWLVRLCALITCWLVVKRLNPRSKVADQLYREFDNEPTNPRFNERLGLVQRIRQGVITLSIQRSAREPGGFNLDYKSDHSEEGFYEVSGDYSGSEEQIWRVEIDTAGVPGTATYKIRRHPAGDWEATLQSTRIGDGQRVSLGYGIHIRFIGTFVIGDYVDVHVFPSDDQAHAKAGGSTRAEFG